MIFEKLKSVIKTPEIEFLCYEEDFGVIPKPYPSRKFMPNWYKELPQRAESSKSLLESPTLKRCPPFLDAMCVGWIIPLAGDVEIRTDSDASNVHYKWNFYRPLVEKHFPEQITTEKVPNPSHPKPPLKWMNYWIVKVPPGYSVLFVPPLNRIETRFTCLSGLVDCDGYFEFVNFPFFFNSPNFAGIIDAGTPLMQVIPFKRDSFLKNGKIRNMDNKENKILENTRKIYKSHNSMYRDFIWNRK